MPQHASAQYAPEISGATRLFGLIGKPVAHSLSPLLHNTSFAALEIDARYLCFPSEDLPSALAGVRGLGIAGCNVTMPYKKEIVPLLDGLSEEAELIGAVNTVAAVGGKLIGYNTDGTGLLSALRRQGCDVSGKRVLVLGSGGAGAAIYTACALAGASHVSVAKVHTHGIDKLHEHCRRVAEHSGCACDVFGMESTRAYADAVAGADIIFHATSAGMGSDAGNCLLPGEWITSAHTIVEAVYHPLRTELLQRAQRAGASSFDGLTMLIGQAALAEKLWLGVQMPLDIVTAAARGHLAGTH